MKRRSFRQVLAIFAGALALTSCTAETGRQSPTVNSSISSGPPSSQHSAPALPHSGAPKVENPLPASVLSGDPCTDAFTPEQIVQIFGREVGGKPDTIATGPVCEWANPDTTAQLAVYYKTKVKQGLSALYQNTRPQTEEWRVLPELGGFPAVAYRGMGNIKHLCTVSVGLADDTAVDIGLILGDTRRESTDPCEVASQAADLAVATLKQKVGK